MNKYHFYYRTLERERELIKCMSDEEDELMRNFMLGWDWMNLKKKTRIEKKSDTPKITYWVKYCANIPISLHRLQSSFTDFALHLQVDKAVAL